MNSVDSTRLSDVLKMPLKSIQKLSLSQTQALEKITRSIPECFKNFIETSSPAGFVDVLTNAGISSRDGEHPVDHLLLCMRKHKVITGITEEDTKLLLIALSRNPSTKLVNISLLCQIWTFWYNFYHSGKENAKSLSDPLGPTLKELHELLRLKYDKFMYVLDLIKERHLSAQSKILDVETFQEELAAVGIKFNTDDFENFLEFLSETGFLVKGNVYTEALHEFCKFLVEKKQEILPGSLKSTTSDCTKKTSGGSVLSSLMRDEPPKRQLKDTQGGNPLGSEDFQAVVFQQSVFKSSSREQAEAGLNMRSALPWDNAPTIRPPEKRHSRSISRMDNFGPFVQNDESNIMLRIRQRFAATDKSDVDLFAKALINFSRHFDFEGKLEYFVTKSSIIASLKEIGLHLNYKNAEQLWNDITSNGSKTIILPEYIATIFGIPITSREFDILRSAHRNMPDDISEDNQLEDDGEYRDPIVKGESIDEISETLATSLSFFRDKFPSIVTSLRRQRIALALIFRGNGNLGISGSVFLEFIRSPPFSIPLSDQEGVLLICEILNTSISTDLDAFQVSYRDIITFFERITPSIEVPDSESAIKNSIKFKLLNSKDVQGSRVKLLALTPQLRLRLRSMAGKTHGYLSWDALSEDLSPYDISQLFSTIDVSLTQTEVAYIVRCLQLTESSHGQGHTQESRITLSAIILFVANHMLS